MHAFQRLLLAGTVLSGVVWLPAGATAWASGYPADQRATAAAGERAALMLAQAPPAAHDPKAKPNLIKGRRARPGSQPIPHQSRRVPPPPRSLRTAQHGPPSHGHPLRSHRRARQSLRRMPRRLRSSGQSPRARVLRNRRHRRHPRMRHARPGRHHRVRKAHLPRNSRDWRHLLPARPHKDRGPAGRCDGPISATPSPPAPRAVRPAPPRISPQPRRPRRVNAPAAPAAPAVR